MEIFFKSRHRYEWEKEVTKAVYICIEGKDIGLIKFFILLFADDIVIFLSDAEGLQNGLNLLELYFKRR